MKRGVLVVVLFLLLMLIISGCEVSNLGLGKKDKETKTEIRTISDSNLISKEKSILSNSNIGLFSIKKDSNIEKEIINKYFSYDIMLEESTIGPEDFIPKVKKEKISFSIPTYEVSAISISGFVKVYSPKGFARIIMVDFNNQEWLVFGSDFMFIEEFAEIVNFCEETCLLDPSIRIKEIYIELLDASIDIDEINFQLSKYKRTDKTLNQLRAEQHDVKVDLVSDFVSDNQLLWYSGDTGVSKKLYRDLKKLQYNTDTLLIPYDFFFYKGGIYKIRK